MTLTARLTPRTRGQGHRPAPRRASWRGGSTASRRAVCRVHRSRSDLQILGAHCAYDRAMQTRWKILVLGLLAFQWVQTYSAWKLMDAIRYQAEGSWLHDTVWGP